MRSFGRLLLFLLIRTAAAIMSLIVDSILAISIAAGDKAALKIATRNTFSYYRSYQVIYRWLAGECALQHALDEITERLERLDPSRKETIK